MRYKGVQSLSSIFLAPGRHVRLRVCWSRSGPFQCNPIACCWGVTIGSPSEGTVLGLISSDWAVLVLPWSPLMYSQPALLCCSLLEAPQVQSKACLLQRAPRVLRGAVWLINGLGVACRRQGWTPLPPAAATTTMTTAATAAATMSRRTGATLQGRPSRAAAGAAAATMTNTAMWQRL